MLAAPDEPVLTNMLKWAWRQAIASRLCRSRAGSSCVMRLLVLIAMVVILSAVLLLRRCWAHSLSENTHPLCGFIRSTGDGHIHMWDVLALDPAREKNADAEVNQGSGRSRAGLRHAVGAAVVMGTLVLVQCLCRRPGTCRHRLKVNPAGTIDRCCGARQRTRED